MTPRTVIFLFPQEMTVEEVMNKHKEIGFSRIPVYGEHRDDIRGFVLKNDILLAYSRNGGATKLKELIRELGVTREKTQLADVLNAMLNGRHHLLLVLDEYGGTAGLVTLEDVVETLIGMEIVDEADKAVDMRALARKRSQERLKRLGITPAEDGNLPPKP